MATKYKGSIIEINTLNAFINLMRAANSLDSRISRNLDKYGLTISQFGVLEALYHLGSMSQKALGIKILKSGGNITKVVDNLENKKLIKRKRSIDDRRLYKIDLTREGENLIKKIFPQHVESLVKEFSVLKESELEKLRELTRYLGKQKRD